MVDLGDQPDADDAEAERTLFHEVSPGLSFTSTGRMRGEYPARRALKSRPIPRGVRLDRFGHTGTLLVLHRGP